MDETVIRRDSGSDNADVLVAQLRMALPAWQDMRLTDRVGLLRRLRWRIGQHGESLASSMCARQGIDPSGPWGAEPWTVAVAMARPVRALERVISGVARGNDPLRASAVRRLPDAQPSVTVFPRTWDERLLLGGYRAEVLLGAQCSPEQVREAAARSYRTSSFPDAGVALLLAAGNAVNLVVSDLLHLLFDRGCVVLVKLNPVLGYLNPILERILEDFIVGGWVRLIEGDAELGSALAGHPGVDRVHMTGSAATHDALVWGVGPQAEERRRLGAPIMTKPFTAELGGVSPVIVVPGPWTHADVRRQADLIVFAKLANTGHVCAAPQILIVPEGWPAVGPLLDEIRALLASLPPRAPYYPGSQDRIARVLAEYANADALLGGSHRVLVPDIDPSVDSCLLREEVFADALGVVRLPAPSLQAYLAGAVSFANERLLGSLAAHLLVDPRTGRTHRELIDRAITGLRYGTVAVNDWAIISFYLGYGPWGAYADSTEELGSGRGQVLNPLQLPDPRKTVITARFRPRIPPATSVRNRTAQATARRLLAFLADGKPRHLPGLLASASRG